MIVWISQYRFLAIMSFIGVGLSATKNVVGTFIFLISMCIGKLNTAVK